MLPADPQTSGYLLVSCGADAVEGTLELFRRESFAHAAVIGEMHAEPAKVGVGTSAGKSLCSSPILVDGVARFQRNAARCLREVFILLFIPLGVQDRAR